MQNLYSLFSLQSLYFPLLFGVFIMFLCTATQLLLYLTGENSCFMFESSQISSYLAKNKDPQQVKLKILFLPFPKTQKELFSSYLENPEKRPSLIFSKTLEQLKHEIWEQTSYNKNIAILFFLLSGVSIFTANISTLEDKILGVLFCGLMLYFSCALCQYFVCITKYISFRCFKKALRHLDIFHISFSNQKRNGIIPCQKPLSPLAGISQPQQKPTPTLANIKIAEKKQTTLFPEHAVEITQPKTCEVYQKPTSLDSSPFAIKQSEQGSSPLCDLLFEIDNATKDFDLEKLSAVGGKLDAYLSSEKVSTEDRELLQTCLDKFLSTHISQTS